MLKQLLTISAVLLLSGCGRESHVNPCTCDLMNNQHFYFIDKAQIISTNSSKHAVTDGDALDVNIDLEADPQVAAEQLKIQFGKIKGKAALKIPLPDFKDNYYHEYHIDLSTMDKHEIDKQMYFITYCSFYPIYHEPGTCIAKAGWEAKVEELRQLYLKSERGAEDSQKYDSIIINYGSNNKKIITNIKGVQHVNN